MSALASGGLVTRLPSLLGVVALVGLAWLLSTQRWKIDWRPVLWGLGLQLALALLLLNPLARATIFRVVDDGVNQLLGFAGAGATFVFQSVEPHTLGDAQGNPQLIAGGISPPVKTFAFWVLPTIIFFSALMSVLYQVGLMQRLVWGIAWLMQRTMRTSGAESLSAAANIFVGQTEAPLVVRPFVERMTMSELTAVMTGGFATVAGGVMAAYVSFLHGIPGIAGHLVAASILNAPAALALSKIVVPETQVPETAKGVTLDTRGNARNVLEAAANGASDGTRLAINVAGMLIAFVALVALVDAAVGLVPFGGQPLSLARVLGWVFAPLAWIMGVPWAEAGLVGQLIGEKVVLTEFISYTHLGAFAASEPPTLSPRSILIASYALCGFANFASIGIQLGGIGALAPSRMGDLAELAPRAMLAGLLAPCISATIAGVFVDL